MSSSVAPKWTLSRASPEARLLEFLLGNGHWSRLRIVQTQANLCLARQPSWVNAVQPVWAETQGRVGRVRHFIWGTINRVWIAVRFVTVQNILLCKQEVKIMNSMLSRHLLWIPNSTSSMFKNGSKIEGETIRPTVWDIVTLLSKQIRQCKCFFWGTGGVNKEHRHSSNA